MTLGEVINVVGYLWPVYAVGVYAPGRGTWIVRTFLSWSELADFISAYGLEERMITCITPFDHTGICIEIRAYGVKEEGHA